MFTSWGMETPRKFSQAEIQALLGALEDEAKYGAVLRADTGRIAIGENSNVQDNAVLHTGPGLDVTVGRGTSVGHGAVVHGCTVGDGCLIGMHATILNGAVIGEGCLIAAGALEDEDPVIIAMMYDAPILVMLGECDRHPEKEEEYIKKLEAHVRLFYKTFTRNRKE